MRGVAAIKRVKGRRAESRKCSSAITRAYSFVRVKLVNRNARQFSQIGRVGSVRDDGLWAGDTAICKPEQPFRLVNFQRD